MTTDLTIEEIAQIKLQIEELRLEHIDLDQIIRRLVSDPTFGELQVKRLKKRKLQLKDELARLEDRLIPDILA